MTAPPDFGHDSAARSAPPSDARRVLGTVAIAATAVALLFLAWQLREVAVLLVAAILVALFLSAAANWTSKHSPLPRGVALALVVLTIFGGLTLLFWLRGPSLAVEVEQLQTRLPDAVERLKERVGRYELGRKVIDEAPSIGELLSDSETVFSRVTGVVSATFGAITTFVLILFLGIVIAAEPGTYLKGALALVAPGRRPRTREALMAAGDAMRAWLLSKLIRMVVIGVVVGVGLMLLGVPAPFLLGVIAALLTFIPNFGPIIAAAPAVLLGLVEGPQTALYVALLYGGVQAAESYLLDPLLDRKIVAIPPGLTLTTQIVLGMLVGPIGLAVATPLAAASVVLVRMLYVEDVLGDRGRRL